MWTFRIAELVWVIALYAAVIGPIHGVSIIPNAYRGPIKSRSDVVIIGIIVARLVEWFRGRHPSCASRELNRRKDRADP